MLNEKQELYVKIQTLLPKLIPENWSSIYLYASVIEGKNGEMYFYYFPKKIIKSNPINCYEIFDKFDVEETTYNLKLKELYNYIKALNHCTSPKWTNITIIIKDETFTIEYHYDDLKNSKYTDEQRRLIWYYKYLNIPIESINFKDRLMLEKYEAEAKVNPILYTEKLKIGKDTENDEKLIKNQILK